MSENKVVEFKTIEEIINTIHLGNKDNFLVDFKSWLEVVINTTQTVRINIELGGSDAQKKQYKKVKNADLIGCSSMKWVDDGMHNISINLSTNKKPV